MSKDDASTPQSPEQRELELVAATLPDLPPGASGEDEFAGIEPYRPRRSPLLAAAVILISGYLLNLRHDLTYALRSRTPTPIADVRAYFRDPGAIRNDSYVRVRAVPDRAHAVMLDAKGKDEFIPFVRVMGTDARLLIAQRRGLRPGDDVYDDVYTGRLLALAQVSYGDTVRAYFAKRTDAARFFTPASLRAALGQVPATLRDLAGDRVTLTAASPMEIDATYPGEYAITLPRERFPTEGDARSLMEQMGIQVLGGRETKTDEHLTVALEAGRRDRVIEELQRLDARIVVALHQRRTTAPWGQLKAVPEGLAVGGATPVTLPWEAITSIETVEPLVIPADAYVLVEGERPQDLWYVPVFAVLFVLFIVWNALALVAAVRGRRRAEAPTT
jgi:hypothetical protein